MGRFTEGARRRDVRIRLAEPERSSPDDIDSLYIRAGTETGAPGAALVPMADLVSRTPVSTLPLIARYNHLRKVELTANMAPGISQGEAISRAGQIARQTRTDLGLPESYRIVQLGNAQAMQQTLDSMWGALVLGFVVPMLALIQLSIEGGDPFFGRRFLIYATNSFILAGLAAALTVAVALILAYALRLHATAAIRGAVRVASLGYAIPGSVIAVGMLIPLATFDNMVDSWMRASFGISTGLLLSGTIIAILFAYMVRFLALGLNTVESGLTRITPSMDEAARTLGAGPAGTLARVHAPILKGSVLTSAILVFVDVLKELPATLIIRPFNFDTLAIRVYHLASDERLAQASTGALTIVAVGLVPVIVLSLMITRSRPGDRKSTRLNSSHVSESRMPSSA